MNSLFLTILVTCQPVYVLHYRNLTTKFGEYKPLDVCLSVHRCICVEKKNQLDATECFIVLMICSTRFGYFYVHHQELETICVLLPPMVCSALVAGGRMSGAGQQAMRLG